MGGEYANKIGVEAPKKIKIDGIKGVQHNTLIRVLVAAVVSTALDVLIFNLVA
jgi:hypothetical protein